MDWVEPIAEGQEGDENALTCPICFDMFERNNMATLEKCKHDPICFNCMAQHLRVKILDGKVLGIKCLDYQCDRTFSPAEVQKFTNTQLFEKYQQFKLNIEIELDPNRMWCPTPGCSSFVRR